MLIHNKDLLKLVSKQSGYHMYEIEDILHALAIVISEEVSNGNEVKVKGLGSFIPKKQRPVRNFSPYTGRYMDVMSKPTCKFKPDLLFLNLLKMQVESNSNKGEDDE